jgi:hypothetical protein
MNQNQETARQIELTSQLLSTQIAKYTALGAQKIDSATTFALGAQLLYFGQMLTELSNFKLEPATLEGRQIISKIVELVELKTIEVPQQIGDSIIEPEHIQTIVHLRSLLFRAIPFLPISENLENLIAEINEAIKEEVSNG